MRVLPGDRTRDTSLSVDLVCWPQPLGYSCRIVIDIHVKPPDNVRSNQLVLHKCELYFLYIFIAHFNAALRSRVMSNVKRMCNENTIKSLYSDLCTFNCWLHRSLQWLTRCMTSYKHIVLVTKILRLYDCWFFIVILFIWRSKGILFGV